MQAAQAILPNSPAEPIEDSAAASTTTKEKTIGEKSTAELHMAVDALLKECEAEFPKHKNRHAKIRKYWNKEDKPLEKKHAEATRSVAHQFEVAHTKATEKCAELKPFHSDNGRSFNELASAGAGLVKASIYLLKLRERERERDLVD